jgi:hypothetical protein
MGLNVGQIGWIASVRELVQNTHALIVALNEQPRERASDEASAPGYDDTANR